MRGRSLILLLLQPHLTGAAISIPPGFNSIVFHDDFNTSSGRLPDQTKWTIDLGTSYPGGPQNWGTGEIQTYTNSPDNIIITPSETLLITPLKDRNGRWTSARIETRAAHDFACGPRQKLRMEARLKFGNAPAATQLGIWPAFWALGAAFRGNYWNWPSIGEIDIVESLNGRSEAWHVVHCGPGGNGGPCLEPNGLSKSVPMPRGEWVTIAFEIDRASGEGDWRREKMVWYVDGVETFSLTGALLRDVETWSSLAWTPKFLLLNVAVGGGFPNAIAGINIPTPATVGGSGAALEVDYVAVFWG